MKQSKSIGKLASAFAVLCIVFLPFAGCGNETLTGLDIISKDGIDFLVKFFIILAILCGLLVLYIGDPLYAAVAAITGVISMMVAYLIAHGKNSAIELKFGAFLAFIGFAVTAIIGFTTTPICILT